MGAQGMRDTEALNFLGSNGIEGDHGGHAFLSFWASISWTWARMISGLRKRPT